MALVIVPVGGLLLVLGPSQTVPYWVVFPSQSLSLAHQPSHTPSSLYTPAATFWQYLLASYRPSLVTSPTSHARHFDVFGVHSPEHCPLVLRGHFGLKEGILMSKDVVCEISASHHSATDLPSSHALQATDFFAPAHCLLQSGQPSCWHSQHHRAFSGGHISFVLQSCGGAAHLADIMAAETLFFFGFLHVCFRHFFIAVLHAFAFEYTPKPGTTKLLRFLNFFGLHFLKISLQRALHSFCTMSDGLAVPISATSLPSARRSAVLQPEV